MIQNLNRIIKSIGRGIKAYPAQILAPLGIFACSILLLLLDNDTIYAPFLSALQLILVSIQFRSIYFSTKADRLQHQQTDKTFIQDFLLIKNINIVHYLPIYKEARYRAWYYRLRGITRLSLYQYKGDDSIGSYTKFSVNEKDLFHLQLKGCIDTTDPAMFIEGINYIAPDYLTK